MAIKPATRFSDDWAGVETIDARGLKCPLPVLKAEKRLEQIADGARLIVLATDPMAKIDIALYCRQQGHTCEVSASGEPLSFRIVKSGNSAV